MKSLPAPLASFALTSPAGRCVETAGLVISAEIELVETQALYDGMLQPNSYGAFQRLGYASLFDYLSDGPETKEMLDEHAEQVVGALGATVTVRAALAAHDSGGGAASGPQRTTLCVFGHAVYLNAAALRLATLRGHSADSLAEIMHSRLEEACGIWVGASESKLLRAN